MKEKTKNPRKYIAPEEDPNTPSTSTNRQSNSSNDSGVACGGPVESGQQQSTNADPQPEVNTYYNGYGQHPQNGSPRPSTSAEGLPPPHLPNEEPLEVPYDVPLCNKLYELSNEPERKQFLDELFLFMHEQGTPINRLPIMAKSVLDLYTLYKLVIARGGLVEVINKKLWQEIIKGLKLPSSITSAAFTLRTQYMKYLYDYESSRLHLSSRKDLQAAIDSNRREGRRSSYGSYETAMRNQNSGMAVAHLNSQMAPLPSMVQAAAAAAAAAAHHQQQHQQLAAHLSSAMSSMNNSLVHAHNGSSVPSPSHPPPLPQHGAHLIPPPPHAPAAAPAVNGIPAGIAGTELEQRMLEFLNNQVLLQQHNAILQAGQNIDLSRFALMSQIASNLSNHRQAAIFAAAAQQRQNLMNNELQHQQHPAQQQQQQSQRQSPVVEPFRFGLPPHHSPPLPMSALAIMEQMNRATPEQDEALNLADANSQGPSGSGLNGLAAAGAATASCNSGSTSGRRGKKRSLKESTSRATTPVQQQDRRRPESASPTHSVVNVDNRLPSICDVDAEHRVNGELLGNRPNHVHHNHHNNNSIYKLNFNNAHQQHRPNGAMTVDGHLPSDDDEDDEDEDEDEVRHRDDVDDGDMEITDADRTMQREDDRDEHQQHQPQPANTSANSSSSGSNNQASLLQTTILSINTQRGNGESLVVKMDLNGVAYEGVLFPTNHSNNVV